MDHDLLDDEELDDKSLLEDHEDELLNPSPPTLKKSVLPPTVKPPTEPPIVPQEPQPVAKKVSLKRNLSVTPIIEPAAAEVKLDSDTEQPPKKLVKLSDTTPEDRLKARAAKFGASAAAAATTISTPAGGDDKKQARAARFGTSGAAGAVDLDTLKKRAERFGATTAKQLTQVEQDEKLKKRQERFGVVTAASTKAEYAAKAQQRLERFKTAA